MYLYFFLFSVTLHDQSKLVICEEQELEHLLNNNDKKRKKYTTNTKNKRKPNEIKELQPISDITTPSSSLANQQQELQPHQQELQLSQEIIELTESFPIDYFNI